MLNDWNKKNSAVKSDICHFVKETYFDEKLRKINNKVNSSKTKHVDSKKDLNDHITSYIKLINNLSGKFKLISTRGFTKDLINWYSILNGAKYFVEDVSQNYFVFKPVFKCFQTFTGTNKIFARKSKGLPKKSFRTPVISDNGFAPKLAFIYNWRIGRKFKGLSLIQDNIYFALKNLINIFVVCKLDEWSTDLNMDFTLADCLFGTVKVGRYFYPDNHGYNSHGFDLMHIYNIHRQRVNEFSGVDIVLLCRLIREKKVS